MRCLFCGHTESKVIDSRSTDEGTTIRRRRECLECGKRFTTYEKIESIPIIVVKKDGTRESFDREKIINGLPAKNVLCLWTRWKILWTKLRQDSIIFWKEKFPPRRLAKWLWRNSRSLMILPMSVLLRYTDSLKI